MVGGNLREGGKAEWTHSGWAGRMREPVLEVAFEL